MPTSSLTTSSVPLASATLNNFSIVRVSVANTGTQGNDESLLPSISDDGRYVAFASFASNLVVGDTNGTGDIFVYDRRTATIQRISLAADGTQANDLSWDPVISGDGRYVAFTSRASNLVPNDTNSAVDVFLYDRTTNVLQRISSDSASAAESNLAISANGRYLTFLGGSGPGQGPTNILQYDSATHTTSQINPNPFTAYSSPSWISTSEDGRYVVFDGQFTLGKNALDIYVYDNVTHSIQQVTTGTFDLGFNLHPSISADGRFVAFVRYDGSGATPEIYVWDRTSNTPELVSVSADGSPANGQAIYNKHSPEISADGRYVTFSSDATNLVANDTNGGADIFVYDRMDHSTRLISHAADGTQSNGHTNYGFYNSFASFDPVISPDGSFVGFDSFASNLVPYDTNGVTDVFVVDLTGAETVTFPGSGLAFVNTYDPSVTADYRSAIIAAEHALQSHITNAVTINEHFSMKAPDPGKTDFVASNSPFYLNQFLDTGNITPAGGYPFADLRSALISADTASSDDKTAVTTLNSISSDPTSGDGFFVTLAQAKALDLWPANDPHSDGTIYLDSNFTYFYNGMPAAGDANSYDAVGALEHEISEEMGRLGGLGLNPPQSNFWAPMDLFRYVQTSNGVQPGYIDGNKALAAMFSIDGVNLLTQFNNPYPDFTKNGDVADWNGVVQLPGGSTDSFGSGQPGAVGLVTATDLRVMDILGWTLTLNQAPRLNNVAASVTVTRGHTIMVSPSLSVSDADDLTLAAGTVAVTAGAFSGDGDVLAANTTGTGITASYNSTAETLTLTGFDTLAHYQQVLDSVTFASGSNPNNGGANPARTLTWIVNDGSSSNNLSAPATTTISISPAARNDFNGDGDSDLLFQNTNGTPQIWLMNGTSVVSQNMLLAVPPSWKVIGTGDFNGDGHADIVWQNSDGTPAIWEMNGTSIIAFSALPAAPPSWHVIATGDFNGDGFSDLVWQSTDGTPAIWEMNGTSIVSFSALPTAPPSWRVIGAGDFNGDGKADVLWQNSDGTPAIWEMNGTSIVSFSALPAVPPSWHVIGTGDFNGDGKADVLWQNSDGTPAIWEMNGTSIVTATTLPVVPPSWQVIGTSDVNGDGMSDILWQNTDGTVAVWQMNGTSLVSATVVGNPGAAWQLKNDGPIPADQMATGASDAMHLSAPDLLSTSVLSASGDSGSAAGFSTQPPDGQATLRGAALLAPAGAIGLGAAPPIGLLDPATRNSQHPMFGVT
jgi:hypothetical protein